MSDNNTSAKKPSTAQRRGTFLERLVQKTLSSFGGIFERPFQSDDETDKLPSTSDLTDRLKNLIDSGVRQQKDGSRVAPHLIRLKYTWGETTDEFEQNLKRLETELLVVAIDHINDNRYRTIAPVKLEIKPDILTEGLTLAVGFDGSDIAVAEKVEIPTEIFAGLLPKNTAPIPHKPDEIEVAAFCDFPDGKNREIKLLFVPNGKSNLTVGRSKENDLFLDDNSVSKLHASLVMNLEGKLKVADVGSTNGTFLDKERISYGKAYEITAEKIVGFGDVKCRFDWNFSTFEKDNTEAKNADSQAELAAPDAPETVLSNKPKNSLNTSSDESETINHSDSEPETVMKSLKNDSENAEMK